MPKYGRVVSVVVEKDIRIRERFIYNHYISRTNFSIHHSHLFGKYTAQPTSESNWKLDDHFFAPGNNEDDLSRA